MAKARRARLAAEVALTEKTLPREPTTGAAFLHSQHIQELRAEEALLGASLRRLRAERTLATARHECENELEAFRKGVAAREAVVAHYIAEGCAGDLITNIPGHSSYADAEATAVQHVHMERDATSGGEEMPSLSLGLATHDAEAAAAAVAAAGKTPTHASRRGRNISAASTSRGGGGGRRPRRGDSAKQKTGTKARKGKTNNV